MKLVYLDAMDIANLDAKNAPYGPDALERLRDALASTDSRLVLSRHHFSEAGESDTGDRRFRRIVEVGIDAVAIVDDPRDAELRYFHACVNAPENARVQMGLTPLAGVLDEWLEDARESRRRPDDIRLAIARFFSIQADPKSYDKRLGDFLGELDAGDDKFDAEEARARMAEVDLVEQIGLAKTKRFERNFGISLAEVVTQMRPLMDSMIAAARPRDAAAALRHQLRAAGVDVEGDDADMTRGYFQQLFLTRSRARRLLDWEMPEAVLRFAVANRVEHILEYWRRRNPDRMTEVGDELDGEHLTYLPFVSLMTADSRTINWINQTTLAHVRQHLVRLVPGGSRAHFEALLERLDSAPDMASPA